MNPYLVHKAFINGEWITGSNGKIPVTNPANGEPIGEVPTLDVFTVYKAIEAAKNGFEEWKATPTPLRSKMLHQFCDHIIRNKTFLADIITMENGKPLSEASAEVAYTASFIRWYAEEVKRVYGQTIPANSTKDRILVQKEPIGVCAMITPWNFPAAMLGRKMAAALAAGCSLVAKPSELTPYSALALAKIGEEVGFPQGLVNIVTGDPDVVGKIFCSHPDVRKISFTGSTQVGRQLMEQSATMIKRCSFELGGNAPFIVFADANIESAIQGAIDSKFRNCGQTCIASNRFLIEESILPQFISGMKDKVSKLKVGPGHQDDTDIGPLISFKAVEKIKVLLTDAIAKGATLHCGEIPDGKSRFVEPVLLSGVSPTMNIWHTEIFGPIVAISTFHSEDQAIALANDSLYGLAAYLYTNNSVRTWTIPEALEYGMIGVNSGKISMAQAPFGGIKQSGFGREGGHYGLDEYLQYKYICQTLI